MRASLAMLVLEAVAVAGIRIVQSNDDGWAESYIRSFNDALIAAGHDVVLSAPADNESGRGSSDAEPKDRTTPCEYNSCPANSGPFGSDPERPDLNWVNSYPVTSIRYGIDTFGPNLWDGAAPELAVAGPNVGSNTFLAVPFSGTVGAAVYAAHDAHIPSIAFSGATDVTHAFNDLPVPAASLVYAQLATTLTTKIIGSGAPYLPDDVWLNVNFPEVEGDCTDASDFQWVLSRINPGWLSPGDVEWCGSDRLPTEDDVQDADGCFISVSMGDGADKTDINDDRQGVVLDKLRDMLVCLP